MNSHWEDANVLAHVRLGTKVLEDGTKALVVEEVQSDWGQEGKKEGFEDRQEPEWRQLKSTSSWAVPLVRVFPASTLGMLDDDANSRQSAALRQLAL